MTRICRFGANRLGVVIGEEVADVTAVLDRLPARADLRCDPLIENLEALLPAIESLLPSAVRKPVDSVEFLSPVPFPAKVIAAPVNYLKHQAEVNADGGKNFPADVKTIDEYGLFLKSSTSVVGPSEGVASPFPGRRFDHEIELVAVIGKQARSVPFADALSYVAGYTLGLDMTLRGNEDRSLRKSGDGFSVLGPWMVTADEIADPDDLDLWLSVNGAMRQQSNTSHMIFSVRRLIEYASSFYTLYPGDVIFTGTPEGIGPVVPGDVMRCGIQSIGEMSVLVR